MQAQPLPCHSALGSVSLARYAPDPTGTLQAWDAADLYLCAILAERHLPAQDSRVLVVNDTYGSMTTLLASVMPARLELYMVNDSFIGRRAAHLNLRQNGLGSNPAGVHISGEFTAPTSAFDLVLLKIPRSVAQFEDQLHKLRHHLHAGTQVFAAAMIRHLPAAARPALEVLLGPTRSHLAVRKARLFETNFNGIVGKVENPHPSFIEVPGFSTPLLQHAAVFAHKKLDRGSALLIENLPRVTAHSRVIDLGCGMGVLGLAVLKQQPDATVLFVDESSAAIKSTAANVSTLFPHSNVELLNQDCLDPMPQDAVDLILCNPPFHAQHKLVSETAERMFRQSLRALRQGGSLYVVGNRHLQYGKRLQRLFGHSQMIAQDSKFQVMRAIRR